MCQKWAEEGRKRNDYRLSFLFPAPFISASSPLSKSLEQAIKTVAHEPKPVLYTVLDFQKKTLGQAGPQVFIFGCQNKYASRQKLYLRINGIQ